jgi:hypothetical protein
MEGSGSDLIEALLQNLPEGAEEILEKPQSGQPVSRPRFKPNTFRIQVQSVIAT